MGWYIFAAIVLLGGFMVFTGAPYVPSMPAEVARALSVLYKLSAKDVLVDIGSGDGLVLRAARRKGARAVGYEINPVLVWISRWLSRGDKGVEVHLANFWKQPMPDDVTVVYTFGDNRDIRRMYDKVVIEATRLGRPIWLISYGFKVPKVKAIQNEGAHMLYKCEPLHGDSA
ncbi:MAG: hypothetical protein ABIP74_01765 [Candidatus Saccharimonas sp.]